MGKKGNSLKDDPLHLNPADREIHIERLKAQIKLVTGEDVIFGTIRGSDLAAQEAFLEHVLAFESQEFKRPFDTLINEGFVMPPPDTLDDAALTATLWEIIHALANRQLFLERTDHLSNRKLYTWLRDDALREEYQGFGVLLGDWHLDVLGGCSEEDLILSMRYYASDEERERWEAEFPDFPMPLREEPPHDRDRLLPKPESP